MNIEEYKKTLRKPLRPRTATFLIKDDQILLGVKKEGFGKNNLNGIGGKVEEGETSEEAARREIREEIGVIAGELTQLAKLNFYFPHIEDESWNQQDIFFVSHTWRGNPQESAEIKPEWFRMNSIPFERMWDDARIWLPHIIKGVKIEGDFIYDKDLKVVDHFLKLP